MDETIRSALLCMGICLGIFAAAQWLRATGALSFLPESRAGSVTAVLGGQMIAVSYTHLTLPTNSRV